MKHDCCAFTLISYVKTLKAVQDLSAYKLAFKSMQGQNIDFLDITGHVMSCPLYGEIIGMNQNKTQPL